MTVLVINCGSSSIKYQAFDPGTLVVRARGLVERIGEPGTSLRHSWRDREDTDRSFERVAAAPDHRTALAAVEGVLRETGVLGDGRGLTAIGHRVVHGGEAFHAPARIDGAVLTAIRGLSPLAPLHQPANVLGIEICADHFPGVPQVAVFDTAFHHRMPPRAFRYAVPERLYGDYHVRRYGFHGISHACVAKRAARHLGRPLDTLNLITLHLGNGASATAIAGGRSVDTSMGMTPLEGLVMGTRCGDIDAAAALYIGRVLGIDNEAVEDLLNHESGVKGLCGANDMREVIARAARGDGAAALALDVYCYRVRKYIGAYLAVLGRLDAIVFTAGVGENSPDVRERVCTGLEGLGITIDGERNLAADGEVAEVQVRGAAVPVLVVRTDEEHEIAEQTLAVVAASHGRAAPTGTLHGGER